MVDFVLGLLETQSRLVEVGPILTIVVALRFPAPKLFVDDASHNLAFDQVMCVGPVDRVVASALLVILLLEASAWLVNLHDYHDVR